MTAEARIELAIDRIETALAKANWQQDGNGGGDPLDVDRYVAAAADLAFLLVGASPERTVQELAAVRERVKAQLAGLYGASIAAFVAEALVRTVTRCKREIEKATVGNPETIQ